MNLPQKIKSYFARYGFHLWKDVDWRTKESFVFPDDETLLTLAAKLVNLPETDAPENARIRMSLSSSTSFETIDDTVIWMREMILEDLKDTQLASEGYGWEYRYFPEPHQSDPQTLCLFAGINSKTEPRQKCIYAVASVRKYDGKFFGWSNVVSNQASLTLRRER